MNLNNRTVRSQIVDEITVDGLERFIGESQPDEIRHLWTPQELRLLQHYVPTTHHRIAQSLGLNDGNRRKSAVMLQLQSETLTKVSTIDAAIVHGRRDEGTVGSKLHNLARLCTIFNLLGFNTPEPIPNEVIEGGDLDDILIQAKLRFAELLRTLPSWSPYVSSVTRTSSLESEDIERFGYISDILAAGKGDVVAIALYGSAAKETDSDRYADYDNYVIVRDGSLERIYEGFKGKRFVNPYDGKQVGVNIIEESVFPKFIRMNHNPRESLTYCKVLYGELEFPIVDFLEASERGASSAVLRNKVLKSAAAWVMQDPDILVGKPALFDYFQKTPLFMVQAALNTTAGFHHRGKAELEYKLSEVGGEIMPYEDDPAYLARATLHAAVTATRILHRFYGQKNFQSKFMELPRA